MKDIELSRMYSFVRGRQLEGTFPGSPYTGVWPITAMRVARGWGFPPEEAWPYNGDASAWPPSEPPGIDEAAKPFRIDLYQRVRSISECKAVLAQMPLMVSVEITEKWYDAPKGRVPPLSATDVPAASHTVSLVGYNDAAAEFKFANSWGVGWGDNGYGYIPDEVFEPTWVEGWRLDLIGTPPQIEFRTGVQERSCGVLEHGGGVLHCRELVGIGEDRMAWAFAVERAGSLEVEEFFVRPEFRGKGYGKALTRSIKELADSRGCPLKIWVSYADGAPANLAVFEKLVRPLGLRVRPSGVRWAPYVASTESGAIETEQRRSTAPCEARPQGPFRLRSLVRPLVSCH